MHDIVIRVKKRGIPNVDLCEAEILASNGNSCMDLLTKRLIALVLGKIKFCKTVSLGQTERNQ